MTRYTGKAAESMAGGYSEFFGGHIAGSLNNTVSRIGARRVYDAVQARYDRADQAPLEELGIVCETLGDVAEIEAAALYVMSMADRAAVMAECAAIEA